MAEPAAFEGHWQVFSLGVTRSYAVGKVSGGCEMRANLDLEGQHLCLEMGEKKSHELL